MQGRLRKSIVLGCASLAFAVLAVASVYFASFFVSTGSVDSVFSRVAASDSRLPISITVFGRSSDTISARLAFYDAEGDLIGTIERSWSGWELRLDCIMIGEASGWLVFPFRLSTDATAKGHGIDLFKYYDASGFPSLYESRLLRADERNALTKLFFIVRSEAWMPRVFGSLRHQTVTVRNYQANVEYWLYVSKNGTIGLRNN